MTHNPHLSIDQKIVGDTYTSSEIMDNLTILCDDFGSRFGGTEGEKLAADFIADKLRAYGLQNVHLEPIEYIGWRRGEVSLEIISPIQKTIPCITLPHSPAANLEGRVIDLGDGAPALYDQRAAEIKGSIVMANSEIFPGGSKRWVHRGEKFGRSTMAGASGFIFVNHYPAYGPATGGVGNGGEALIPAISVAMEDGALMSRLIKRYGEVKIRLKSSDRCEPMVSWNVIGDLPGTTHPDEIVMLGCHYDGHDISQGAIDPASGAVSVMEAARVLAQYATNLPRTVRFALWGIEEIGLIGSRSYAAQHEAELDKVRFYFNMDAAGGKPEKGVMLNEWPELAPLFANWSEEMTLPFGVGQSVNAFSDHYPFMLAGVPTGGMEQVKTTRTGRGYGHTRYDTLDKADITLLREAAVLAARLAVRITSAETWPVARRSREAVTAVLDSPSYREREDYAARLEAYYKAHRG
ncbi:MAG: M20/M25/M40 family metallo-hydrolase [Anaerolineales bacterium]|nr:M20/M25/M40 family metallo-hydrolase [Anaerolineales bacterium]